MLSQKQDFSTIQMAFSYFDGKWVVFYQNFPFGAAHGLKSWVQLESEDLVHFRETGVKVFPDTPLDSHGAYSGFCYASLAIICSYFIQEMFVTKTGTSPLSNRALMDKDGKIEKD